ncbi:hypothetical protein Tco_0045212 [Tanacetum coccineum]
MRTAQIGLGVLSRVAVDPDSDDDVLAEILFRGKYISGARVVIVDKIPDDEIVDPRVKVETIPDSTASPPRSRRKHRGVRSDDSLWDKPVEDFFSSESESDDDMATYIPPLPYGAFKDWEMVICPLRNSYYHVYYQENRRQKSFFYLKELLPHVYREDLLLLRRRMNRYFRLNPDVDVVLTFGETFNPAEEQSLHSDDDGRFWRTQETWVVEQLGNRIPKELCSSNHGLTARKRSGSPMHNSGLGGGTQILDGCQVCPKTIWIQTSPMFQVLIVEMFSVDPVHAGSFDAAVVSLVSAACVDAATYFVSAVTQSSCVAKIYLETWY